MRRTSGARETGSLQVTAYVSAIASRMAAALGQRDDFSNASAQSMICATASGTWGAML